MQNLLRVSSERKELVEMQNKIEALKTEVSAELSIVW